MVDCPVDDSKCKQKTIFKDIVNHLDTHSFGIMKTKIKNNKFTIEIGFGKVWTRGAFWDLMEFKSTDGMTFYFIGKFAEDNLAFFWLYFLGSPREVKNYTYTMSFTINTGEKFTYYGDVKPLDETRDDIIGQWSGFAIRTEVIKKALYEKHKFQIEIRIHALKEEAKDTDMESGVSADESE